MRRALPTLLLLAIAASAPAAAAPPPGLQLPSRVYPALALGTGNDPQLLVDADGTAHVVWVGKVGDDRVIHYRRAAPGARRFGPSVVLATLKVFAAAQPQIVRDRSQGGRLTVLFDDPDTTQAVVSADGGLTWSAATQVLPVGLGIMIASGQANRVASTEGGIVLLRQGVGSALSLATLPAGAPETPVVAGALEGSVVVDRGGRIVTAWKLPLRRGAFVRAGAGPARRIARDEAVSLAAAPSGPLVGLTRLNRSFRVARWTARGPGRWVDLVPRLPLEWYSGPFKPFLRTAADGRLNAAWTDASGARLYLATSLDGARWTRPLGVTGARPRRAGLPFTAPTYATGPGGAGWVVWASLDSQGTVWAMRVPSPSRAAQRASILRP